MQPALQRIGRIYTTISLAVLPVALVVMFTYIYSLDEKGPQAQGLPALMVILAVLLGVLGINTLVATLLSVFIIDVRPKKKPYFLALLVLAVVGALTYALILLPSAGHAG